MRVLQICTALDGGGVDRYLLNYCTRIPEIAFDFIVIDTGKKGILESELEKQGTVYRIPRLKNGIRKNYAALRAIMSQTHYDAVHVHFGYKGVVALLCAKRCGIKVRIVHSHWAAQPQTALQAVLRHALTFVTKRLATALAACGEDAARWMWGARALRRGKVSLQNNAVDTAQFQFSPAQRRQMRQTLQVSEDTLLVGHVGRLCEQKNQLRLLDIFHLLHQQQPQSRLLLIGRGGQEQEICQKIDRLGLHDCVQLLGVREDVPMLLNALDVMIFPSLFEGFPVALVETQCNGLPIVCSDSVTASIKMSESVSFLSLRDSDQVWVDAALEASKNRRYDGVEQLCRCGYDLNTEAQKLKQYYFQQI